MGPATVETVDGDWSDVNVAVSAAALQMEMTILDGQPETLEGDAIPDPDSREYRLRSVTDRPAWVRVRRAEGPGYEVSAKVGRFGDPDREEELIGWISLRLVDLTGVEVRRMKWRPN